MVSIPRQDYNKNAWLMHKTTKERWKKNSERTMDSSKKLKDMERRSEDKGNFGTVHSEQRLSPSQNNMKNAINE